MDKKNYNTKNRKLILDFLKQNQATMVSALDILDYLKKNEVIVNRSTIYRYLNRLCDDGLIMKYVDNEEGKTVFQYVDGKHECSSQYSFKMHQV
jgi:Fe2+/Zn2+ uptake regulation proteins